MPRSVPVIFAHSGSPPTAATVSPASTVSPIYRRARNSPAQGECITRSIV